MPDVLVGATIRTTHFPKSVYMSDSTAQANISSTTYVTGSPDVAVSFVAPLSGTVMLTVGFGARDNGGANRVHMSPEVRSGSSGGSVVVSPDVTLRGVGSSTASADYQYISRTTLLTGLSVGATYFARVQHKVSGGSTADIGTREILVCPTPMGGGWSGQLIKALDYPPAQFSQDITAINNPAVGGYVAGTPQVDITFMAPTSGRILLVVGGALGNGTAADRILLSPEVRIGNVSGAVILSPTVTERGFSSQNNSNGFHYGSRESILEGLIPGTLYFARVMYAVINDAVSTTISDIAARDIAAYPLP